MIPINLLIELQRRNEEEIRPATEEEKRSRMMYRIAEGHRDLYQIYFNKEYKHSKNPDANVFIRSMIKSLYRINRFNEVFYKKETKEDGTITHYVYFHFNKELEHDCTLMSGLYLDFEEEFTFPWWRGWKRRKNEKLSLPSDLLFKWHEKEYTKIAMETTGDFPVINIL